MKRMMILIPLLALLMLFAVVAPVLAEPAQKLPVTLVTSGAFSGLPEKIWTTDGGIIHSQGQIRGGVVTLTIGQGPAIVGTYSENGDSITNTKTHEMIINFNKMVVTFPGGSFEGAKTARFTSEIRNGVPVTIAQEQHAVLQGSGIYEGQTLKISQDWVLTVPAVPKVYTGVLIVP